MLNMDGLSIAEKNPNKIGDNNVMNGIFYC